MYLGFLIILNLNHHYLSVLSFVCYAGLSVLEQGGGSMPRITAGLGFRMERRISLISPRCGMIPPLLLSLSRIIGLGVWNAGRIKTLVSCGEMLKKREEIMQLRCCFFDRTIEISSSGAGFLLLPKFFGNFSVMEGVFMDGKPVYRWANLRIREPLLGTGYN